MYIHLLLIDCLNKTAFLPFVLSHVFLNGESVPPSQSQEVEAAKHDCLNDVAMNLRFGLIRCPTLNISRNVESKKQRR